jgi:cation diffusion facilitator CzcD-associated flavoprotein CzcO
MSLSTSKKTIAIIGARVSGLQAARTLLTHPDADSYQVTIFEARNRIGGRAHTNWRWGFPLDYSFYYRCQRLTGKVPTSFMEQKETHLWILRRKPEQLWRSMGPRRSLITMVNTSTLEFKPYCTRRYGNTSI